MARVLLRAASPLYSVERELPGLDNPRFAAGSGQIEKKLVSFNDAARHAPFVVILDLDERSCAPGYRDALLPRGAERYMILRIAVREVESWLLADRDGFARYLGVAVTVIPPEPDDLPDPKRSLFDLVRRSRRRSIRESILPIDRTARLGPDYNGALMGMVNEYWSRDRAVSNSPSLQRAVDALDRFRFP
ncbi:MAG: hypothetical protein EA382_15525 [Spirochaetaceae bacterium]|nr:MAG: hypothetical protein EA382_15525 [Spirochaetaceae bacterium]